MITYPISFFGESHAAPGIKTNWDAKASDFSVTCAVPKEFEGDGAAMSPEDLYLLALQNCFVATFKVYAQYSKLEFGSLDVKGQLVVDLNESKKPVMKSVHLNISLHNTEDQKKANLLVKKTLENGFILQSVKTDISFDVSFH